MEEGVWGVSALFPNLVVGFLSGGIAGALVGYVLQRLGRVSCVVSEWSTSEEARRLEVSLFLDFFNTRAVDTGIRGLCLLYRGADGEPVGASPLFTNKGRSHDEKNRVASINLPANSLTSMKLYGSGNEKLARHVAGGGRVDVFGYFPNKKDFSHPIDQKLDSWNPAVPMEVRATRQPGT